MTRQGRRPQTVTRRPGAPARRDEHSDGDRPATTRMKAALAAAAISAAAVPRLRYRSAVLSAAGAWARAPTRGARSAARPYAHHGSIGGTSVSGSRIAPGQPFGGRTAIAARNLEPCTAPRHRPGRPRAAALRTRSEQRDTNKQQAGGVGPNARAPVLGLPGAATEQRASRPRPPPGWSPAAARQQARRDAVTGLRARGAHRGCWSNMRGWAILHGVNLLLSVRGCVRRGEKRPSFFCAGMRPQPRRRAAESAKDPLVGRTIGGSYVTPGSWSGSGDGRVDRDRTQSTVGRTVAIRIIHPNLLLGRRAVGGALLYEGERADEKVRQHPHKP